ncbi:hypothetical protein SDC9_174913 [bioreactor metagenome]|uniref:Uncharacterized protein n=1 Tax=bioreactor metagenome TaxID=1076179 RepID=A0A645GNJ9_9ZZZZ
MNLTDQGNQRSLNPSSAVASGDTISHEGAKLISGGGLLDQMILNAFIKMKQALEITAVQCQ